MKTWVLAGALVLSLGCERRVAPKRAPGLPVGTLRRPWPIEPASALPIVGPADGYSQLLGRYIYEGLVAIDARTGAVEPALASKVDLSADGLTVRAALRKGVTFQDGSPVRAADVVASFEAARSDRASLAREALADLAAVKALDEGTIEIRWTRPYFRAVRILADVVVIPEAIAQHGLEGVAARRQAPGTGPFTLAAWNPGDGLELRRNERHWGRKPLLETVAIRFMKDPADQLAAFKRLDLDLCPIAPSAFQAEERLLSLDPRWRVLRYPRSRYDILRLNLGHKTFADVRVRRAVALALDRTALARQISDGTHKAIGGPVFTWPGGLIGFDDPPAPDREAAAKLVTQAKPPKTRLLLRINAAPETKRAAAEVRTALEAIGLHVDVEVSDRKSFLSDIRKGAWDLAILQEQASPDEDPHRFWHSRGDDNHWGYANRKVDTLLEKARATADDAARGAIYRSAAAFISDDAAAVYLWRYGSITLVSRDLEGVDPAPLTGLDDIRGWSIGRR